MFQAFFSSITKPPGINKIGMKNQVHPEVIITRGCVKISGKINRLKFEIKSEIMNNTVAVAPVLFDLYPTGKIDFAFEKSFKILSGRR